MIDLQMLQQLFKMKKGIIQKSALVNDDEKFLEGINLVTGDKIDYSRRILSETQVTSLCVNENLPKIDKFLYIMSNGEKIQKWSLLENVTLYIENVQSAEKILSLIQKNFVEYEQFITIMGEGISKYLKKCQNIPSLINKKCYQSIYRIMYRTLTNSKLHGSEILSDWMIVLNLFFHLKQDSEAVNDRKCKLTQLKQYINGSFSMTTLPQRRKTALQMINALMQVIGVITKLVILINFKPGSHDLNPSTRLVICNIIQKILQRDSIPEIWKCVADYYYQDKSAIIKDKAFSIMSKNIFHQLDIQETVSKQILIKYSSQLLKTFQRELKSQPMYQVKTFSFLNRLLRQNTDHYLEKVVECYKNLLSIIPQIVLISELQLKRFNLQNIKVICSLIQLFNCSSHIQFRDEIKKQILKGLRYHQFYVCINAKTMSDIIDILDLNQSQDINIFLLMLSQQIDYSKWKNVVVFLDRVAEIKFYQSHLQKMIANILKIYVNCPYFILQKIHQVIMQLLLVDRKGMDVYIKIRQKCLSSKNWMLRRNFIKMYTYLKVNGSYQLNKYITPLVYKNIVNEKISLIKIEFVNEFYNAYSYLDPNFPQEKVSIKEVISRFAEDKDKELSTLAQATLEMMRNADKDFQLIPQRMSRNKELYNREILVQQVQPELKKHVKTEKLIGAKDSKQVRQKPKKGSMMQVKTIANLPKMNQFDKIKLGGNDNKNGLIRSTSTQNKKDVQKLLVPTIVKRSRF